MTRLSIDSVKEHFLSKGFDPWAIAETDGRIHTLDLFEHGDIVMSFRVAGLRIDLDHIVEVVKRYAAGEPCVHPHTREVSRWARSGDHVAWSRRRCTWNRVRDGSRNRLHER